MHDPKFGLFMLPPDIAAAQETGRQAERDGFFSVSHNDHFYSPLGTPESPQLECFTVLTAVAAVTETIRLAPAVAVAGFRNPALLAKVTTSVDLASQGRFICGIGAGWQGKEYETHGYPFPPLKERLEQLDETLEILKAMWTEEAPAFQGRHFMVRDAYNNPRPVQKPHPPIMLGGSGTGLLRLAAKHADILNIIPPTGNGKDFVNDPVATVKFDMPTMMSRIEKLRSFCREADRDPDEIELGGLMLVGLSEDAGDASLRELAKNLGFPDYETAQASPVALLGTPDEAKRTLEARIRDTRVTYYIVVPASEASYALLVKDVMPAFAG